MPQMMMTQRTKCEFGIIKKLFTKLPEKGTKQVRRERGETMCLENERTIKSLMGRIICTVRGAGCSTFGSGVNTPLDVKWHIRFHCQHCEKLER